MVRTVKINYDYNSDSRLSETQKCILTRCHDDSEQYNAYLMMLREYYLNLREKFYVASKKLNENFWMPLACGGWLTSILLRLFFGVTYAANFAIYALPLVIAIGFYKIGKHDAYNEIDDVFNEFNKNTPSNFI